MGNGINSSASTARRITQTAITLVYALLSMPSKGLSGISRMELIGPDDAVDAVAITVFVICRPADPESCDLRQHLGAVVDQVRQVPRDLIELPDVIGDRDADMVRAMAGIGIPAPGTGIQMQFRAFLAAIAAGLPRKHRAGVTRRAWRRGGPPLTVDTDSAAATG